VSGATVIPLQFLLGISVFMQKRGTVCSTS